MDIKSAYLNGSINEDIYMQQLKGYEEKGREGKILLARNDEPLLDSIQTP